LVFVQKAFSGKKAKKSIGGSSTVDGKNENIPGVTLPGDEG